MSPVTWSFVLTVIGATVFFLAGRKVWWCWYLALGLQGLWTVYAVVTGQWGFLLGVVLYSAVYAKNAWVWTMDHRYPPLSAHASDPADPLDLGQATQPGGFLHWSESHHTIACLVAAAGGRIEVPYEVMVKDYEVIRRDSITIPHMVIFTTHEIEPTEPASRGITVSPEAYRFQRYLEALRDARATPEDIADDPTRAVVAQQIYREHYPEADPVRGES